MTLTSAQQKKLDALSPVLNHYENHSGILVVEKEYGSSRFCRMFIGKRGGFSSPTDVFKDYDTVEKKPFGFIFTDHNG